MRDCTVFLTGNTSQDMIIVVGCSNQVINFYWELFPVLNRTAAKLMVVNYYDVSVSNGRTGINLQDLRAVSYMLEFSPDLEMCKALQQFKV
ncbi:putative Sir2-like protein [Escherichia phage DT57C]|uniref:Putative Sir2-like protein n=1 Tax=Escherichia phage DT57C TaxID=2681606 RepID=A0A0A7RSI2_9CAUD|nr:Sir2 (NAD-dependent deacetylase) [Escherichia phage DT57C]AJA41601.1 putative Sir2-like protein [Escherichia phage DT57C]